MLGLKAKIITDMVTDVNMLNNHFTLMFLKFLKYVFTDVYFTEEKVGIKWQHTHFLRLHRESNEDED